MQDLTPMRALGIVMSVAALAALAAGSSPGATRRGAPVVLGAGPRSDPTDRPGGGFLRVTFSPDGDGRGDRVEVVVRSSPGHSLALNVHAESQGGGFATDPVRAAAGATTLTWDGLDAAGQPLATGSYVVRACDLTAGRCAATPVLAHLRILSLFTPRGPFAVSPGETIPVVLASDRVGPFGLDLAPAADPRAPGVGVRALPTAGTTEYRIPDVSGGLWLLRARSGTYVTYYPLVVHEPSLPLRSPPPHTALVVYPYITWRAYDRADLNRDGEVDSWYSHPLRPAVPLRGPFERLRREPGLQGREASPGAEQAFARWMGEHGLVGQHVTDVELGRMPLEVLRRYAVIVFPGHTEYYERGTYDRLLSYRDRGGRLYFLQGNSFYGEVRVGRSSIVRLSYRYRTPRRSDFRLAVTGFRSCCWPSWISPRYRLAPDVRRRLPWLLEGTDLQAGDLFGLAQREVDAVDPRLSPPGTIVVASAVVPRFASPGLVHAYRWIGTRRFEYEPAALRPRRIDVAYAATGLGEVFSWGNSGFMQSLDLAELPPVERAALDRVALNVWERFVR